MINMNILKGIGKIGIGAGAVGAGTLVITSGVNDIQTEIRAGKMIAASAAEASEDIDFGVGGIVDDISGSEDAAESNDDDGAEQSAQ